MDRATAALFVLGISVASTASAMTLSPGGVGQVLLFPYYTVNRHQQTLINVTNTTDAGKALQVRFREALNGREVLSFRLFLSPHDTWAASVFALEDAGLAGNGPALLAADPSCTAPQLPLRLPDDRPYQPFLDFAYTGGNNDKGPEDDARMREGFLEIIELAELTGDALAATQPDAHGVPANCLALTPDPAPANLAAPAGGLIGTEAIVNVAQGTMFSANATAIDGFANHPLISPTGTFATLADASPSASGVVSAYVPLGDRYVQLDYPSAQAIDAVSALLMADRMIGAWDVTAASGAHTDWVVTLPTKQFYVDPAIIGSGGAIAPFTHVFGEAGSGEADADVFCRLYDRSGKALVDTAFDPRQPSCRGGIGYETQVFSFQPHPVTQLIQDSAVLGSHTVIDEFYVLDQYAGTTAGTAAALFNTLANQLRPSNNGMVMNGLPVIGFAAIEYVNANVTPGVLANYSGAFSLQSTASCTRASGSGSCLP